MRSKITSVLFVSALLFGQFSTYAADAPSTSQPAVEHQVIAIWPGIAPGSETWTQKEVDYESGGNHRKMVRNVTHPTLTVYLPDPAKANGTAVVVAPGGGFRFLSWDSEGLMVAQWLADHGVTALVLKYRLYDTGESQEDFLNNKGAKPSARPATQPSTQKAMDVPELACEDGRQAMKVVRQHAAEWKIKPDHVGFMGFSAGGYVTMGVVMNHDADSRPDFAMPIYGPGPAATVPADAMPMFILCAGDDKGAMAGSLRLYGDWIKAKHPAELHVYAKGGHGFGMNHRGLPVDSWIERMGAWMQSNGWMMK